MLWILNIFFFIYKPQNLAQCHTWTTLDVATTKNTMTGNNLRKIKIIRTLTFIMISKFFHHWFYGKMTFFLSRTKNIDIVIFTSRTYLAQILINFRGLRLTHNYSSIFQNDWIVYETTQMSTRLSGTGTTRTRMSLATSKVKNV